MRRSRFGGLMLAALALPGAIAGCARDEDTVAVAGNEGEVAGFAAGLAGTTTTTAPPPPPTTTTTVRPPLPLPDPIPANAYAPTPQVVLGTIELPTLGVKEEMQEGITLTAIDRGPGHWPGTPAPGGLGNMVVAGHRTTKTRPFHNLDKLNPGDPVVFETPAGTFTYEVRGIVVVPQAHIGIAAQSYAHTATLFACHPKGSASHRIVAKLRLLGPDGKPVDEDEALPPIEQGTDPATDTTLLVRDTGQPMGNGDPLGGSGG